MPVLRRENEPDIHYEIDYYTGPWKNAPYVLLQSLLHCFFCCSRSLSPAKGL